MKNYSVLVAVAVCSLFTFHCGAQGTAFTYQGRLNDTGNPATGIYDLRFTVYDSSNQPAGVIAGPLTNSAVSVDNGLFTTTLDFGANVFTGANRWLEIAVRPQGGAFATLSPRQAITSVPYAAYAMTPAGPQGPIGPVGPAGAKGDKGDKGDIGLTGPQGPQGEQGIQGPIGLTGATGAKGDKGDRGDTGLTGPQGLQGEPGIQGPIGLTGATGAKGDKGDKGDTGLTGPPGPEGPVGPQGPEGPLSPNVALRAGGNTFTDPQLFNGYIRLDSDAGFSQSSRGPFHIDAPFVPGGRFAVLTDGRVGIGTNAPQEMLSVAGGMNIDQNGGNDGTIANALSFGSASGEAIGSRRQPGPNQYGLDFYTGFAKRLTISNNGHVATHAPTTTINGVATINGPANLNGNTTTFGTSTINGDSILNGNSTTIGNHTVNGFSMVNGNQVVTGDSAISGNVAISPPSSLNFGAQTRQMLNLFGSGYGIGVQSSVQYYRSDGGFAWYRGGVHNDNFRNAGGGTEIMWLNGGGDLYITGGFGSLSDRNAKQDFEPVDSRDILEKVAALPLVKWSFKKDPATRHIGPIAQDFYEAFEVGADEKYITTVDADGVALAAIQGLNQKIEEKNAKIVELEERLLKLEQLITGAHGDSK